MADFVLSDNLITLGTIAVNTPAGVGILTLSQTGELTLPINSAFFSLGVTPATQGAVRLPVNAAITFRNTANNNNVFVLSVQTADVIHFGEFNSGGITVHPDMSAVGASAYALLNEVSSETNPTLIPNRGNLTTGIGGLGGNLVLVLGGLNRLEVDGNGISFFGGTPVVQASAYTQTFATADKTHELSTFAAVAETASTQTTPFGYTTAAQADAIPVELNDLGDDVADLKALVNSVIDDLQAYGLFQ